MTSQKTFFFFFFFFFLHFSVLDTMYRWSMMKNIHSQNLVGIGSWGPEIWPHEYLISPTEISVNWPGSNSYEPGQFTLITVGLIRYSCQASWTNSCQIWCVRVLYHVLLKYDHENAGMQKTKFDDVTLQYIYRVCYLRVVLNGNVNVIKLFIISFITFTLCSTAT